MSRVKRGAWNWAGEGSYEGRVALELTGKGNKSAGWGLGGHMGQWQSTRPN